MPSGSTDEAGDALIVLRMGRGLDPRLHSFLNSGEIASTIVGEPFGGGIVSYSGDPLDVFKTLGIDLLRTVAHESEYHTQPILECQFVGHSPSFMPKQFCADMQHGAEDFWHITAKNIKSGSRISKDVWQLCNIDKIVVGNLEKQFLTKFKNSPHSLFVRYF